MQMTAERLGGLFQFHASLALKPQKVSGQLAAVFIHYPGEAGGGASIPKTGR